MSTKDDLNKKIVEGCGVNDESPQGVDSQPQRPKPFISDEDLRIGNIEFVKLIREREKKIEEIKKKSIS